MGASMERGDERVIRGSQGRGSTDAVGPSWYDVRKLAQDLERMYGRRVGFVLGPHECQNLWDSPVMLVRAYLALGGPWSTNTYWAGSRFGGTAGRATMAGAAYQALMDLWDIAAREGMFADV